MFKTELAESLHKNVVCFSSNHDTTKTWQLHRVRASCLTTQPCLLQALWPPCSNYKKNSLWFQPGLCLKPKRVFTSWNMAVIFCKWWLYSSDTIEHQKNLLLDHDFAAEYWINTFNIAMILEEDGSRYYWYSSLRWRCREHFVSGCWHSSGRDRGRYPRKCWLSTLGVLHPGVPAMWYGHIRDLFPTAEGCKGSRLPNVTMLHWACYRAGVRQ